MTILPPTLLAIAIQATIVSSFVLEPERTCPVSYPCICKDKKMLCSQQLMSIFPVIEKTPGDWSLYITYNNISHIPANAFVNIKLKELIMDQMNLGKPVTIDDDAFKEQSVTLEKISMVDCGLTKLSPAFRNLFAVKYLAVDANSISSWDDSAMRFLGKSVTEFHAAFLHSCSDVYKWPPQFFYFQNLEKLDLTESSRFVSDLDNLSKFNNTLTKLVLARMGLTEVPSVLKSLPKLTDVDLSFNQLNDSVFKSDSFQSQTDLIYLDISYNNLLDIPDGLGYLKSTTYLDVSGNPMTTMTTSKLPENLVQLIGHHCKLTSVPANLQRLASLEKLEIYTNSIKSIGKDTLNNMPNLTAIFFGGNVLTSPLPKDAFKGDNNLDQISIEFDRRSNVTFSFSQIQNLPKLKYLTLSNPSCTCDASVVQWWTGLANQPVLDGHCINTSKKMKDFLTTCQI